MGQPKKMDSGLLKAKQCREESEMRGMYQEKEDFCFRPRSAAHSGEFETKFHLPNNATLRNRVAFDQNKEAALESKQVLLDVDWPGNTQEKPPFITAVGKNTTVLPSKFELELQRARMTTEMHRGSKGVNSHRFRDEAEDENFELYFHAARDKNRSMADQVNEKRKKVPRPAWGSSRNNSSAHKSKPRPRSKSHSRQPNVSRSSNDDSKYESMASMYSVEEYRLGRGRKGSM